MATGVGDETDIGAFEIDNSQDDFGDAPASYGTSTAFHAAAGPTLGQLRDAEPAPQAPLDGSGDDTNGAAGDDEDGVSFTTQMVPGGIAAVDVTVAGGSGLLDAFIDFDGDGAFDSVTERITPVSGTLLLSSDTTTLPFLVPITTTVGSTFARFRLSPTGGLDATSFGGTGEVEDYAVTIDAPPAAVYVDDDFAGAVIGTDPDGAGPATAFGFDAFLTIQAGVGVVSDGGVVHVAPGTYVETVAIAKDVTLTGMSGDASDVTIDPVRGDGVAITAGNVTIRNLTVQDAFDGIHQVDAGNLSLDNVRLLNNIDDGVEIELDAGLIDFNRVTVTGNADDGVVFSPRLFAPTSEAASFVEGFSDTDGLYSANGGSAAVLQTTLGALTLTDTTLNVTGRHGLTTGFVSGETNISGVEITGSGIRGAFILFAGGPVLFEDTTVTGFSQDSATINSSLDDVSFAGGNYSNNGRGIRVNASGDVTISDVTVDDNVLTGLSVNALGATSISDSSFSNNGTANFSERDGIFASAASLTLDGVTASGNTGTGVRFRGQSFSDTDGNHSGNGDHGILLEDIAGDVTLIRSTLENNNADNDDVGSGLHAIDGDFDADFEAIGGNLSVLGATIRDTDGNPETGDVAHQDRGIYAENVGGNVTFGDSTGVERSVTISGNDRDGVAIGVDNAISHPFQNGFIGGSVEFSGGAYTDNATSTSIGGGFQFAGIVLAGVDGPASFRDIVVDENFRGLRLANTSSVTIDRSSFSHNLLLGVDVQSAEIVQLTNVTANHNFTDDPRVHLAPPTAGLWLSHVDSAIATGGSFSNNRMGIDVFATNMVHLTDLIVDANLAGLRLRTVEDANVSRSTISNSLDGSGIISFDTSLDVINSTISGNSSSTQSGGIHSTSGGSVTVSNSTITNNRSDSSSGGIYSGSGNVILNSTIVADNNADFISRTVDFAGMESIPKTFEIQQDGLTIRGGAGVFDSSQLALQVNQGTGLGVFGGANSALVDSSEHVDFTFAEPMINVSYSVRFISDFDGDGDRGESVIEAFDEQGNSLGTMTVTANNFSNNTLNVSALFGNQRISWFRVGTPTPDAISIGSVTFTPQLDSVDLSASSLTVHNSLIGVNLGTNLSESRIPSADGNLVGTIFNPLDPVLGPLQDNGGPARTHALLDGSSAIDAGSNPHNLPFDQRGPGFPRELGTAIDIGALESIPVQRPMVESVVVDDGTQQRSRVRSLTVTFDTTVAIDAGAFVVSDSQGNSAVLAVTSQELDSKTVATITFVDPSLIGGSLADGNYTLTIDKDRIRVGSTTLESDYIDDFYRFFGDVNGDRTVDNLDLFAFRRAYRRTDVDAAFNDAFDVNDDGVIDNIDLFAYRRNYRRTI